MPDDPKESDVDGAPENATPRVSGSPYEPAPTIKWEKCDDWTYVSPIMEYLAPHEQLAKDPQQAHEILAGDVLFKMPLYTGKFLYQGFNKPVSRPKQSAVAGLWERNYNKEDPPKGQKVLPKDKKGAAQYDDDHKVSGVSPEMKDRLDWAQRRLWYYYCNEMRAASKQPSIKDFPNWLSSVHHIGAPHNTLRTGANMHSDGCAIDIGAGDAPFICVQAASATKGGPPGAIVGEHHDLPDELRGNPDAGFFYVDNAYQPTIMAFTRASLFVNGSPASLEVAAGKFPHALPNCSPYDEKTPYSDYAEDVCLAWDRFKTVSDAWVTYCKQSTYDGFSSNVIQKATLPPTPKVMNIPIEADLVDYAKEGNKTPPDTYTLKSEPVAGSANRRRRTVIDVPLGDIKANQSGLGYAAYFQMLRDKETVASAMVIGNLAGVKTDAQLKKNEKGKLEKRIPCVWPPGWAISIMDSRDVTNGFMGVTRLIVKAMVEAGFTWLGATGNSSGEPINSFTGDIMHFDLRTLHGVAMERPSPTFAGSRGS